MPRTLAPRCTGLRLHAVAPLKTAPSNTLSVAMNRIALPGFASAIALLCSPALSAGSLTPGQLEAAERVFVGTASCDANQQLSLVAVPGQPGQFTLSHKETVVTLVTQETASGAVRLEDAKSG